jgi:hypothetical protein
MPDMIVERNRSNFQSFDQHHEEEKHNNESHARIFMNHDSQGEENKIINDE